MHASSCDTRVHCYNNDTEPACNASMQEALDEANKKAVNARSAAESAQKEADSLRPKYQELKVRGLLWQSATRQLP